MYALEGSQGWMIMLTSFLGLSNGYLTVCVLTEAPKGGYKRLQEEERQNAAAVAAEDSEVETTERYPIEEVALIVPETDDPTLPVTTFRAWLLGILLCVVLIFFNTFFRYRTQPLVISAILMQILALPAGRFLARVLLNKEVSVFGGRWSFNLNPRPFNMKEHVIITVFAKFGVSSDGSIGAITVMMGYSDRKSLASQ